MTTEYYAFEQPEVQRIVNAVRKVEKLPDTNTGINGTISTFTKFDEVIICKLTETLTRTGRAKAVKVWRETYVDDFEPITEDEFDVVAPTLEGTYPPDTICYAFYYRPCKEWFVFHADGCPTPG